MGENGSQNVGSSDGEEAIASQFEKEEGASISDQREEHVSISDQREERSLALRSLGEEKPAWDYLNDRQRAFVRAYISCGGNIEQAALRAGWATRSGYSPLTTGRTLLDHYYVKKAIREYWDAMHMTPEEVIGRLAQQARNEIMVYITHDAAGQPRLDTQRMVEDGKSHLIKGLKVDKNGNVSVDVFNAQDALVHIGRSMQMFGDSDKTNVSIGVKRLVGVSEDEL